ncbi:hypothetical protein [Pannonibacter sp. SL95]|uniref:hypothetical protein n=1 Tax=Pannonibacter sp. SL95 TaxID=2995153 RepID=UPI002273E321|nr:hypothetical protein [Pannonibacter sp. SL95]MCY1705519.1 hypothetical protein [Pannonibacter sp. SL95]
MSLDRYASAARSIAEELQQELRDDCFETLPLPTTVGTVIQALLTFQGQNRSDAIRLLGLPPAQRAAFLSKVDVETRFWLLAVATHLALQSVKLLEDVDNHLQPGGPYRAKLRSAAGVVIRQSTLSLDWWPFADLDED